VSDFYKAKETEFRRWTSDRKYVHYAGIHTSTGEFGGICTWRKSWKPML